MRADQIGVGVGGAQIGLVHDLAEALVGDITPHCGVSKVSSSLLLSSLRVIITLETSGSNSSGETTLRQTL